MFERLIFYIDCLGILWVGHHAIKFVQKKCILNDSVKRCPYIFNSLWKITCESIKNERNVEYAYKVLYANK